MGFEAIQENIIIIQQGTDYEDTVTLVQSVGGAPFDLTGCQLSGQLRDLSGSLKSTAVLTSANPQSGEIDRLFPSTETALLTPCENVQYVWGIRITLPGGKVLPQIKGGAVVEPAIVQDV